MKFTCPVCKTAGNIPEEGAAPPATQTTCQKCGTGLSIVHATGRVQALTEKHRPPADEDSSDRRPKFEMSPVLSTRPQEKGRRDHLAISVFALVLCALIATGLYFSLNIKQGALNQPLQMISELVDDVVEYGKSIWGQVQKASIPNRLLDSAEFFQLVVCGQTPLKKLLSYVSVRFGMWFLRCWRADAIRLSRSVTVAERWPRYSKRDLISFCSTSFCPAAPTALPSPSRCVRTR